MRLIIDAMGGDKAPAEIVKGVAVATNKFDHDIVLVGNKPVIEELLKENEAKTSKVDIVHTETVITMEDDPICVVRSKKDSSMSVGLNLLKSDGDAFVSAGNTGALHAGSSLIIRSVKGVQRSGIATILPFKHPILMMDCGANVNVTSNYLAQWAVMGSIYMKNVHGIEAPTVGLLNNGTEDHKGTQIQIDAYKLLKDNEKISFAGNIEAKELPFGPCDVLVTDGFTGNVTLKLLEGMGSFVFSALKDMFTQNAMTKLSFVAMKKQLKVFKKTFDASEYGGAPLLGLQKPVIKAHGSSDARAITNAINQAAKFVKTGVISEIALAMGEQISAENTKE